MSWKTAGWLLGVLWASLPFRIRGRVMEEQEEWTNYFSPTKANGYDMVETLNPLPSPTVISRNNWALHPWFWTNWMVNWSHADIEYWKRRWSDCLLSFLKALLCGGWSTNIWHQLFVEVAWIHAIRLKYLLVTNMFIWTCC